MTTPTTTQRQDSSLTRDLLYAARYYLWRPRSLLILSLIAIVAGLALNWSWLVAAGIAPILISVLPCLIMCAAGVCLMCRSGEKQSTPVRENPEARGPPTALSVAAPEKPAAGTTSSTSASSSTEVAAPPAALESNPASPVAGCCQGSMNEGKSEQANDLQPNQERRDSHA